MFWSVNVRQIHATKIHYTILHNVYCPKLSLSKYLTKAPQRAEMIDNIFVTVNKTCAYIQVLTLRRLRSSRTLHELFYSETETFGSVLFPLKSKMSTGITIRLKNICTVKVEVHNLGSLRKTLMNSPKAEIIPKIWIINVSHCSHGFQSNTMVLY